MRITVVVMMLFLAAVLGSCAGGEVKNTGNKPTNSTRSIMNSTGNPVDIIKNNETNNPTLALGVYLNNNKYEANARFYQQLDMTPPDYLKKALEVQMVTWPRLLINEIYARNGYQFKDRNWLSIFQSCGWYKGGLTEQSQVTGLMNRYELSNLDFIRSFELGSNQSRVPADLPPDITASVKPNGVIEYAKLGAITNADGNVVSYRYVSRNLEEVKTVNLQNEYDKLLPQKPVTKEKPKVENKRTYEDFIKELNVITNKAQLNEWADNYGMTRYEDKYYYDVLIKAGERLSNFNYQEAIKKDTMNKEPIVYKILINNENYKFEKLIEIPYDEIVKLIGLRCKPFINGNRYLDHMNDEMFNVLSRNYLSMIINDELVVINAYESQRYYVNVNSITSSNRIKRTIEINNILNKEFDLLINAVNTNNIEVKLSEYIYNSYKYTNVTIIKDKKTILSFIDSMDIGDQWSLIDRSGNTYPDYYKIYGKYTKLNGSKILVTKNGNIYSIVNTLTGVNIVRYIKK